VRLRRWRGITEAGGRRGGAGRPPRAAARPGRRTRADPGSLVGGATALARVGAPRAAAAR
jgi:hypothetical protein